MNSKSSELLYAILPFKSSKHILLKSYIAITWECQPILFKRTWFLGGIVI